MKPRLYHVENSLEYYKAAPGDLVRLLPAEGCNAICLPKYQMELLVYAIVTGQCTHISGPTGSAKSSLIEALQFVEQNFASICQALKYEVRPLRVYPIEMVTFETPGELYQRRAIKDGTTFDEDSALVRALRRASECRESCYHLIWLRELGRVHSSAVQGGLLDLMTGGDVTLPSGERLQTRGISWVADSNYQAASSAVHTLITLDDACKRRFQINLTLEYLSAEQETAVMQELVGDGSGEGDAADEVIVQAVQLGQIVRKSKEEGSLQSIVPPTIFGYLAFYNMVYAMPHLSRQEVALATMLGNASAEDSKQIAGFLNQVFGLTRDECDDFIEAGGLF